jgi:flagellar hook-associated protein 1 FlgK
LPLPTVLAASVVYSPTSGATVSYNGWTAKITGAPAANDTFTVGPNTNGVADNRNALLMVGLQTKNILAGSTASYQSAYSQIVSSIGIKTRDINVTAQAQASLVKYTQQSQQSLSGVNLDEEAANLLRYQQAYQAAGKMMQIASTMFDTLLSLGK